MVFKKIDQFLPKYDFVERHQLEVFAAPRKTYQAFKETDFTESKFIRWLLFLRGINSDRFIEGTFTPLIDIDSEEILWGLIARPWKFKGGILVIDSTKFCGFHQPGYAKIVWGFSFAPTQNGTLITTETRIHCTDKTSRIKFGLY